MRANRLCSSAKQEGSEHGRPSGSRQFSYPVAPRGARAVAGAVREISPCAAPGYGFSIPCAMPSASPQLRAFLRCSSGRRLLAWACLCVKDAVPERNQFSGRKSRGPSPCAVPDCLAPRRRCGPRSAVPHSPDVLRTTERRSVPIFRTDLAALMRGPYPCYAATRAASLPLDGSLEFTFGRRGV